MKNLIGKSVKVISDNDNYDNFRNKILVVTHADNKGLGYDDCMYPQLLCDFEDLKGNQVPFALYEYEFEILNKSKN